MFKQPPKIFHKIWFRKVGGLVKKVGPPTLTKTFYRKTTNFSHQLSDSTVLRNFKHKRLVKIKIKMKKKIIFFLLAVQNLKVFCSQVSKFLSSFYISVAYFQLYVQIRIRYPIRQPYKNKKRKNNHQYNTTNTWKE